MGEKLHLPYLTQASQYARKIEGYLLESNETEKYIINMQKQLKEWSHENDHLNIEEDVDCVDYSSHYMNEKETKIKELLK